MTSAAPVDRLQADFYDDPVVYDVLHAPGTAREVRGLLRIADTHAPAATRPRTWLEPACGTARYLRLIARRGERVFGFDASPDMIAYARTRLRAPDDALFVADMADFHTHFDNDSIDVAFNLVNSIRHLHSDKAMLDHLRGVRCALRPHGIYVVGIHLSADGLEPITEDVWQGARGPLRVVQVVQYEPPRDHTRLEKVVSEMIVATPTRERHIGSVYHLRTFNRAQWRALLHRAGFEIAAVVDELGRPAPEADGAYALFILRPA